VSRIRFCSPTIQPTNQATPSNSADFADTAIVYKLATKATLMLPIIPAGGTVFILARKHIPPQIEIKLNAIVFLKIIEF
jgi:hypothetical protein